MIKNTRTGKVLAEEQEICRSIWCQARGLMFSRQKNLVFELSHEKFVPLHMFFVFFPIDVVFLDMSMKVVDIKKGFKPFTLYNPKNKAKFVLELKNGAINASGTKTGDLLELTENH